MRADQVNAYLVNKFNSALDKLPPIIGNAACIWVQDRFLQSNWIGDGVEEWPARVVNNKKTAGRKLLVKSGALLRSFQKPISIEARRVVIGSFLPYARIHNDGGEIHQAARSETFQRNRLKRGVNKGRFKKGVTKGRGLSFGARVIHMPQRRYVGNSADLVRTLNRASDAFLLREMKK